ncbi:hypothetical protein F5146DRAFT_996424 [Armillaria mellea]|nr:hypothetical protein F5146DRAFT_996424 [Armillaria mellea]
MTSTVATAKPIDFSRYKKDDDGGRIVTAISIFGVPTYPKKTNPANGTHLVHWRVHLRWAGARGDLAKGSVVLDTYKDEPTDPIVRIEFRSLKQGLSVQTVVDLITANGRERYKYDGNGSGCLSWSTKLLADYVAAAYVGPQATGDFTKFIVKTRKDEATLYWIPDDQGTYI